MKREKMMKLERPRQRLISFADKSRFSLVFPTRSRSPEPQRQRRRCELGRLHNPQAQKYCHVPWVLSYKAHYATETKRRHRPPRCSNSSMHAQNTHTQHTHTRHLHERRFNLHKDMYYQHKSQCVSGLLIRAHAAVHH